jgi:hypothetical protein
VELVSARDDNGKLVEPKSTTLTLVSGPDSNGIYHYTGEREADTGGSLVFGVRLLPSNPSLLSKHEMGLVRWA